jgi:hypothetical protein
MPSGSSTRIERGRLPPAPPGYGRVFEDLGFRLGILHGEPRPPLDVANDRGPELGVVGKAGIVGRETEQRRELVPLLGVIPRPRW